MKIDKVISLSLVGLLLTATAAQATTIFEYSGSSDPTSGAWGTLGTDATMGYTNGADNAWTVNDDATDALWTYYQVLDTTEVTDVTTSGWVLTTTMKVLDTNNAADLTRYVDFRDHTNAKYWGLDFGSDASGNTIVTLRGSALEYNVGDTDFHTYSLVYDAGTGTASLYIDGSGTATLTGYTGLSASSTSSIVRWGSTSSASIGSATYQSVTFSSIPEPSQSSFMVGAILLGLGLVFKRRR